MANLKASKKDIRKTARRTAKNMQAYVALDKALKDLKKDKEGALNKIYSLLDGMSARGIIKKNAAARKKSRITRSIKHV